MNILPKLKIDPVRKITMLLVVSAIMVFSATAKARPATFHHAQPEVYAIGDLHGDFNAMVGILRAARLIDSSNRWIGGSKTLVQVGDQLDRGNTEKEILDLFESLIDQASQAGGQVLVLNGNHETMNVALDFRYITSTGFRQFESFYTGQTDSDVRSLPASQRGRAVAFKPGGPYARVLADHNSIVQIGETVYVHGGITESHANYGLDRINSEISEWMHGYAGQPSSTGSSGPLWNRDYGGSVSSSDCSRLANALSSLNAKRLVIAHTRQTSINQVCNGMVWRIDVGMASYYNGKLQALKITNDDLIQIVEENGRITDTGFGDGSGGGGGGCISLSTPSAPTASNVGSTSYTLSWSSVSGADSYLVQRWNGNAWQNYSTVSGNSIVISGEQGERAYARVIAINACGDQSSASNYVTVTMNPSGGGCATPSAPSQPVASNIGSGSYTISWGAISGAVEYQIQRWSQSNGAWQNLQRTSNTSATISGEQREVAYSRVIAINSCGDVGNASDYVTVNFSGNSGGGDSCPSGYTEYSGTISSEGNASLFSDGYYHSSGSGTHAMKNIGSSVEMRLYFWNGDAWDLLRSSSSELSYSGGSGYYYPYLSGNAGQSYKVCLLRP